jgi:predicted ribosome quality control (RQC) complex YloA/Tae2 family protein
LLKPLNEERIGAEIENSLSLIGGKGKKDKLKRERKFAVEDGNLQVENEKEETRKNPKKHKKRDERVEESEQLAEEEVDNIILESDSKKKHKKHKSNNFRRFSSSYTMFCKRYLM